MQFIHQRISSFENYYVEERQRWAPTIASICKKFEGPLSYFNLSWAPQFIRDYVNSFYVTKINFEYCQIYDLGSSVATIGCSTAINALTKRNFPLSQITNFKEFSTAHLFSRRDDWGYDYSTSRLSALYDSCSLTDQEIETRFHNVVASEKDAFWQSVSQNVFIISSVALIALLAYKCYKRKSANPIKVAGDAMPLPKAIEVIQGNQAKHTEEPKTDADKTSTDLRDQQALETQKNRKSNDPFGETPLRE